MLTAHIRNDGPEFRVSWFSAWAKPQHFPAGGRHEARELVDEGRNSQYGVVITMFEDPEPTEWRGGIDNRTPARI